MRTGGVKRLADAGGALPQTRLTLYLPNDAKVFLSGRPTRSTGALRRFATTQLKAGQDWKDYKVEVEIVRNGQPLRQLRRVNLSAGREHELRFDFDAPLTMR